MRVWLSFTKTVFRGFRASILSGFDEEPNYYLMFKLPWIAHCWPISLTPLAKGTLNEICLSA